MIRSFLRYLLYESVLSGVLHEIVYFRWNKRYRSQEGFLSGDRLHAYLDEDCIFQYHPEEEVFFKRPLGSQEGALPKQIDFYVNKKFTVSAGEVYEFDNAFLIGENAVGVTSDGQIILDTQMNLRDVLHKCGPKLLMNHSKIPSYKDYDCLFSMVNIFSNNHQSNYFHWVMDCCLCLEGLFFWENITSRKALILVPSSLQKFQLEFLSILGIESNRVVFWEDVKKVSVKALIVAKNRREKSESLNEIISPQALKWLRKKTLPHNEGESKRRIFISRQNSNCRRVANMEAILPVLQNLGVEVVDLEGMKVLDQIRLFYQSDFIVTVHGAALTNLAFCRKEETTVLEILGNVDSSNDFQWYCFYYSLSQVIGIDYAYLIGETVPASNGKVVRQNYDVNVDPIKLEERLKQLLNGAKN